MTLRFWRRAAAGRHREKLYHMDRVSEREGQHIAHCNTVAGASYANAIGSDVAFIDQLVRDRARFAETQEI